MEGKNSNSGNFLNHIVGTSFFARANGLKFANVG